MVRGRLRQFFENDEAGASTLAEVIEYFGWVKDGEAVVDTGYTGEIDDVEVHKRYALDTVTRNTKAFPDLPASVRLALAGASVNHGGV